MKIKNRFVSPIIRFGWFAAVFMSVFATIALSQTGTWTPKASILFPRYFTESAVADGVLYTTGGWNGCTPYNNVDAYDPATDTWTPRAPMLTARGNHALAELNGLLYAVGGQTGCGVDISSTEAYDPTTNAWTMKAPLPAPRAAHDVAVANGKIYVMGGIAGGPPFSSILEYDPVTNTWTERAPMPTARFYAASAVVDNIIYMIGGTNNVVQLATVEAYDPQSNTWTTKAPLPEGRSNLSATVLNGKIYAVGGVGNCTGHTRVDIYDPVTGTWSMGTPLPVKRNDFGIATLNNSVFVVGDYELIQCGNVNERSVSTVFSFVTDTDSSAPTILIASPAEGATYLLGQSVFADYSCEDESGGSGIASCTGSVANGAAIDTASVGAKTFTVTAEDNAGNISVEEVTYNVIYNFGGFTQPVENLPTLNIANAGSAIPVKFSLSGYQGFGIFAAGYPASGKIACDAHEPGSEIEETATPGGSTLSYNPTYDQYSYVWKTDKSWKGSCRMLVVRLNDGTNHFAKFRFK